MTALSDDVDSSKDLSLLEEENDPKQVDRLPAEEASTVEETSPVKKRRTHVGTLCDGWTPYDPEAKVSSWYLKETLLGLVLCFTQVPQIVAFSLMAHVDPTVGMHATWILGIITAILGGRPAMINGTSGSFAAMIATFVHAPVAPNTNGEGIEYLFPSVIAAGIIMIIFSIVKLGRVLINITGSPILIGFCDGLAITIAKGQINYLKYVHGVQMYWTILMLVVSMLVMEFAPKLGKRFPVFKLIPSALLAIFAAAAIEYGLIRNIVGHENDTVGDIAKFSKESSIPRLFFQNDSIDLTLLKLDKKGWIKIIFQGFMLAAVGTFELLLVGKVVDGFTKTTGNLDQQTFATGLGNLVAGLMTGTGGTAMIGLSTINGINGGEGRISSLVTALCVMIVVMGAYPLLNAIPVAALCGIIFVVVYRTFKWFTLDMILFALLPSALVTKLGLPARKVNRADVLVIVTVVTITLVANLFYAVASGIFLSILVFTFQVKTNQGTWKYVWRAFSTPIAVSKKTLESEDSLVYIVNGPLFFGSFRTFMTLFTPSEDPPNVIIYMEDGRIYDYSSLEALNKVCKDYKSAGKTVNIMNLTEKSKRAIRRADGTGTCNCCSKISLKWVLGDIEIASDDQNHGDDVIELKDMLAAEAAYGVDGKGFAISSGRDDYAFA